MIYRIRRAFIATAVIMGVSFLVAAVPAKAEDSTVTIGVGDTVLTINGRTSPSAFVTILDDGIVIGTATANSVGDFSHTFTAFAPGIHQINVYARDAGGRTTSPATKEVNVAEHAVTTVDFFLPPTLAIDNSTVLVGTPIHLQGSTIPGGKVVIVVDDVTRATVIAGPDGTWQYNIETGGMAAGNHTVYAVVSDPLTSEQSYPTAKAPFTLIAPESLPPFVPPVNAPPIPVITYPPSGSTIGGTELTVRGTAQPGTRVELFDGSQMIGSTFANSRGEWDITISLSNPSYSLRARACNLFVCSDFSEVVTFFWQSAGQLGQGLAVRLEQYWFLIAKDSAVTLNIHISGGRLPYAVSIDWGDGSTDHLGGKDTQLTVSHTYKKTGRFIGTVTVTDKDGTQVRQNFSVEVTSILLDNWWLVILILITFILILLLLLYHVRRRRKVAKKESLES